MEAVLVVEPLIPLRGNTACRKEFSKDAKTVWIGGTKLN
jgi:hypothetical protein